MLFNTTCGLWGKRSAGRCHALLLLLLAGSQSGGCGYHGGSLYDGRVFRRSGLLFCLDFHNKRLVRWLLIVFIG